MPLGVDLNTLTGGDAVGCWPDTLFDLNTLTGGDAVGCWPEHTYWWWCHWVLTWHTIWPEHTILNTLTGGDAVGSWPDTLFDLNTLTGGDAVGSWPDTLFWTLTGGDAVGRWRLAQLPGVGRRVPHPQLAAGRHVPGGVVEDVHAQRVRDQVLVVAGRRRPHQTQPVAEVLVRRVVAHHTPVLREHLATNQRNAHLTTHSTHFIYGYIASDIWLRTILIVRKETSCRHMGYSFRLTARVLLYVPSHRQDSTYHGLCYTSRGALAGTRNSSMGRRIDPMTHRIMSEHSYHGATYAHLTMHSVAIVLDTDSDRTVLFNDILNTFYLLVSGISCTVKDHSDSETGNLLVSIYWLLFPISGKEYLHHPPDRIVHTTSFVTPVVEHWVKLDIAQWDALRDWFNEPLHHEHLVNRDILC